MTARDALTDFALAGRGFTRLAGRYVIGKNRRNEAVCLYWRGRVDSEVSGEILAAMYREVDRMNLNRPLHVWAITCTVGETKTFRFHQITGENLDALGIHEDRP